MRATKIAIAICASLALALLAWASPNEGAIRERIVETAQSFKGVPYVYGAESPEAFDCSGFVQYVYAHAADISIPRNSRAQWEAGRPIDKSAAKPGDVLVFDTAGGGGPSHVAIFLGNDKMIHAISEGPTTGVVVSPTSDRYFGPRMMGARYFVVSALPAPPTPAAAPPPEQPKPAPSSSPTPAPAPRSSPSLSPAPAPKPSPAVLPVPISEYPVSELGFVLKPRPEVFTDKIPAATGTSIAFTITNATGRSGVFHVIFYKADVDFSKTRMLREDREEIPVGGSVEIAPYLFTEPGVYRLNVKTADNTQLMQRSWKVVELKK